MILWSLNSPFAWAELRYRKLLVIAIQATLVTIAFLSAVALRQDLAFEPVPMKTVLAALPILVAVRTGSLGIFGLHQGLWRYVSVSDLLQIIKASTVGSLILAGLVLIFFDRDYFPPGLLIMDWAANILLLGGMRMFVRVLRERILPNTREESQRRLLIVGAGAAGAELCRQALNQRSSSYIPVAFVDDDPGKLGTSIFSVPIAGRCEEISAVVQHHSVDIAIIAIPSATHAQRLSLVQFCDQARIPFRILPSEPNYMDNAVNINRVKEVDATDLLSRPTANLDTEAIRKFIGGKRVLVTGAAGSVGSELARQIASFSPALLCLIDRAENPLMFLEIDIRTTFPDVFVVDQVGDVADQVEMARVMATHKPDVVFHAAAHKHVHLMERTPGEAVKNNIGGTYVTAKCAQDAGVGTFVFVSTDKAVKPSSVMGATKRAAELVIQSLNQEGPTRFISVRFGNVLGSNASVVPIFKQQIAAGGPLTVTDRNAERYFMSISEAAGLILQAGSLGAGGEIFVLDMGEPVKILALAETLIRLAGLKPYQDVDIVFTGLRSGEKLTEELHFDTEDFQPVGYDKLMVLRDTEELSSSLADVDDLLRVVSHMEGEEVRERLRKLVPEYRPTEYSSRSQASADVFLFDRVEAIPVSVQPNE